MKITNQMIEIFLVMIGSAIGCLLFSLYLEQQMAISMNGFQDCTGIFTNALNCADESLLAKLDNLEFKRFSTNLIGLIFLSLSFFLPVLILIRKEALTKNENNLLRIVE